MTFRTYASNIQAKSGKSLEDFCAIANKMGLVKVDKTLAKHTELFSWLKCVIGLSHVHAIIVVLYLRLRTKDQKSQHQNERFGLKHWVPGD